MESCKMKKPVPCQAPGMPMPLVKIGYLFLRTVAKPVASMVKKQAKDRPAFRRACSQLAQLYHRLEVRLRRGLASNSPAESNASAHIKPLDEQKAIELGASFIGEAIVFGVAGLALVLEAQRTHRAEMARRRAIERKFEQAFSEIDQLNRRNAELQSRMHGLSGATKT